MKSLFSLYLFGKASEDSEEGSPLPPALAALGTSAMAADHATDTEAPHGTLLRTLGWVSAGAGALALGLLVGREIRGRYKFRRRTPYDFYAHAGDERELEFGVGI